MKRYRYTVACKQSNLCCPLVDRTTLHHKLVKLAPQEADADL